MASRDELDPSYVSRNVYHELVELSVRRLFLPAGIIWPELIDEGGAPTNDFRRRSDLIRQRKNNKIRNSRAAKIQAVLVYICTVRTFRQSMKAPRRAG